MNKNNFLIRFLYGTRMGRNVLEFMLKSGADQWIVKFLCSPFSRVIIKPYIKKHQIPMQEFERKKYNTFQEFFAREKKEMEIDQNPTHLISPCDGWLSIFPIREDSSFFIKGSHYQLQDFIQDKELSKEFHGGSCLIFRLCASDYHHYCYIDDGFQGENHYIPGELHSVQPLACETYSVYTLNRRVWTLLATENFGPVIQTEIGAFFVGGISNEQENGQFFRGMEKGHFELAGSTIVLLFQKNQIRVLQQIREQLNEENEVRVKLGMWIGEKKKVED